jgi:hypothetical protein
MPPKPKEPTHEAGQQARQIYLEQARRVIGESNAEYATVYQRFAENDWAAMQLDRAVVAAALKAGMSAKEVVDALHQGPYIQYQVHQKQVPKGAMTQYARGVVIQEVYRLQQQSPSKSKQPSGQKPNLELE